MASFDTEMVKQLMHFTAFCSTNNKNQTKNKQAKDKAKQLVFLLYFMLLTLKKSSHSL